MTNKPGQWAGRKFTRKQMLKRDIRSAQTRSDKSETKVSLARIPTLEKPDEGDETLNARERES